MALAILDGNQSATTLSTILTSGQHIPAHTVVSLGTQAITDMRSAVSGSVVSISNFPATQPVSIASVTVGNSVTIGSLPAISGTVTANAGGDFAGAIEIVNDSGNVSHKIAVQLYGNNGIPTGVSDNPLPISGTVTIGNTVTIAGTVTANPTGTQTIAGSVTLGAGTAQIGSVTIGSAVFSKSTGSVSMPTQAVLLGFGYDSNQNFVGVNDEAPLPVQIYMAIPAGTNRIGVVTIGGGSVTLGASTAQIGSVTASISNSVVTFYPMQGTTVTNSNFTSTTASTTLVSAVANREVLTVFNEGAGNLHISPGATCTTISYQVRLSAGDYWECPAGQLSLAHTAVFATAGTARVTEVS